MRRIYSTALIMGPLFLVGCGSSPSGSNGSVLLKGLTLPPGTNAIVAVKSTAGRRASPGAKSMAPNAQAAPTVVIDSAMIVFEAVTLHLPADGVDDGEPEDEVGTEIELEGPFLVDLVAESVRNLGVSNLDADADDDGVDDIDDDDDDSDGIPDDADGDDDGDGIPDADDQTVGETQVFDTLVLPSGTYGRIKFTMDQLDVDEAPTPDDPMVGLSVHVTGSIDGVRMEFCSDLTETFEFRSSAGIVVDDNSLATFLLTIDPVGWFAGVDPAAGTLSADGVLRICGDMNSAIGEVVANAITDNARLGRDDDGDGVDDEDEDGDLIDDDDGNGGAADE